MAADISTITQLIQDFSCETREEAVTVQVLGSLLQRIADIIGTAALQTDVSEINNWRKMLTRLSSVLTNITNGTDDRNQVNFSLTKGLLASGSSSTYLNSLVIRQATTERAGVMRAQQVLDLNKCKSDINAVNSSLNSLNTELAKVNTELIRISQSVSMKQNDTIHIECQLKGDKLYIKGARQLIEAGLLPVIFRYSVRTSRYGKDVKGERSKMPTRRGWNRFFDKEKIIIMEDDSIQFRDDTSQDDLSEKRNYDHSPQFLFSNEIVGLNEDDDSIKTVKVAYGQKSFNVLNKIHRFKFAIGFCKPASESNAFSFSDLCTNLAIFRVQVLACLDNEGNYHLFHYLSL